MTKSEFENLSRGDLIEHKGTRVHAFIVSLNYGDRVTAISSVDMTNPSEIHGAILNDSEVEAFAAKLKEKMKELIGD